MIDFLKKGFENFKKNYYDNDKSTIIELVKSGQKPKTMVIACSDSRVDPAILFQAKPGEIFAVRNVANLIPHYNPDGGLHGVSAAIEFGVRDLNIKHIIILGHAHCGGITTLCNNFTEKSNTPKSEKTKREFIDNWVNISAKIKNNIDFNDSSEPFQHKVEKESIKNSMKNLITFPWVLNLVKKNKLIIHGWWFDIENGELFCYDKSKDKFINLYNKT